VISPNDFFSHARAQLSRACAHVRRRARSQASRRGYRTPSLCRAASFVHGPPHC
jgi:hypothetical protein